MILKSISLTDIHPTLAPAERERVESMKLAGQRIPVILRRNCTGYAIVAGSRRIAELRALHQDSVLALVEEEMDDLEAAWTSLISNASRSENPMHEARDIALLKSAGFNEEEIASRIGRSQSYISNRMGFLDLIPEFQKMLEAGKIGVGAARNLKRLPEDLQRQLLEEAAGNKVTSKMADEAVRKYLSDDIDLSAIEIPQDYRTEAPGQWLSSEELDRAAAGEPVEIEWNGVTLRIERRS